ncbi:succinate dehydrogenase assembly factor 2, mitochondrial-like [Anneissia japonica]|uniref:succinate dehydrogenase assembly factor 2, mitochondrial-like n=1 Tax=Anneissia japonica TaxID=1529436 RepID=UPI001425A023|nr:succinate dehydrogenase assembly factor 2, mitochondrial-like [Anneissia japonica]
MALLYAAPLRLEFRRLLNLRKLFQVSAVVNSKQVSNQTSLGEPSIPEWKKPENEDENLTRARLLYQSRKRGMLENGLLLSSFADQYLATMTSKQLHQYDVLINKPSNDWDIYYWVTGNLETPADYDCEVMDLLKEHAKNANKESRITQPKLKAK